MLGILSQTFAIATRTEAPAPAVPAWPTDIAARLARTVRHWRRIERDRRALKALDDGCCATSD